MADSVESQPASAWRRLWVRSRYEVRTCCDVAPSLFASLYGLRSFNRAHLVQPDTHICIEGFPRSANSYAVLTFARAQAGTTRIAHHLHVTSQIVRAARWGVPSIVLVRRPLDAATSLLIRHPELTPGQVLRAYAAFHRRLERFRDHFVLAPFDEAVRDLGPTIERVNARFGTAFQLPETSDADDVTVFRLLDRINATQGRTHGEHAVSRPSAARSEQKRHVHRQLTSGPAAGWLRRSETHYERLLGAFGFSDAAETEATPLRRAA